MVVQTSGLGWMVTGQHVIWYFYKIQCLIRLNSLKYFDLGLNSYRKVNNLTCFPLKALGIEFDLAVK